MGLVAHPVICDGCGKDRRTDANHWFIIWEFYTGDSPPGKAKGVAVIPFELEEAVKPHRAHTCGINCTTKLVERFLSFGSIFTKPSQATEVKH